MATGRAAAHADAGQSESDDDDDDMVTEDGAGPDGDAAEGDANAASAPSSNAAVTSAVDGPAGAVSGAVKMEPEEPGPPEGDSVAANDNRGLPDAPAADEDADVVDALAGPARTGSAETRGGSPLAPNAVKRQRRSPADDVASSPRQPGDAEEPVPERPVKPEDTL